MRFSQRLAIWNPGPLDPRESASTNDAEVLSSFWRILSKKMALPTKLQANTADVQSLLAILER